MKKQEFPDHAHIGRSNCANFIKKDGRRNVSGPDFDWTYRLKVKIQNLRDRYNGNKSFRLKIDNRLSLITAILLGMIAAYSLVGMLYAMADYFKYHKSYAAVASICVGIVMLIVCVTAVLVIFKGTEPLDRPLPKDVADYDKRLN